jgi:hypothetical protein
MSVSLQFRNPQVNILEKTISTSGKYMLFIGIHFEKGHTCWVVGCSNKATGEMVMRHYNEQIPGCVAPQAQAYTYWEEFKTKMKEPAQDEEPSYLEELQQYLG